MDSFNRVDYRLGLQHLSRDSPAEHPACHAPKSADCTAMSLFACMRQAMAEVSHTAAILGSNESKPNPWRPPP